MVYLDSFGGHLGQTRKSGGSDLLLEYGLRCLAYHTGCGSCRKRPSRVRSGSLADPYRTLTCWSTDVAGVSSALPSCQDWRLSDLGPYPLPRFHSTPSRWHWTHGLVSDYQLSVRRSSHPRHQPQVIADHSGTPQLGRRPVGRYPYEMPFLSSFFRGHTHNLVRIL